jgi:hypothetical protein
MKTESERQNIVALTNNIVTQAKTYLDEAGEFYPFGSVIDSEDKLRLFSIHSGDEFPLSETVIKELETALDAGFKSGRFLLGAIGIDSYLQLKDNKGKMTALEVRIMDNTGIIATYRFPYEFIAPNASGFYTPIIVYEDF